MKRTVKALNWVVSSVGLVAIHFAWYNGAYAAPQELSPSSPTPSTSATESLPSSAPPSSDQATPIDPFSPISDMNQLLKILPRDPFKKPPSAQIAEDNRTPLERYDKSEFKLIGVMTGPHRLRGMLFAPDKKTYFVAEKTRIGLHGGYVKKITPTAIYISETITNEIGLKENSNFPIKLADEKIERETTTADRQIKRDQQQLNPSGIYLKSVVDMMQSQVPGGPGQVEQPPPPVVLDN